MTSPLRVLKFDSVHPHSYLEANQRADSASIKAMSYEEYYAWLMGQRVGLSDYLTHPMNQAGWTAREFLPLDVVLRGKLSEGGEVPSASLGARLEALGRFAASISARTLLMGDTVPRYRRARKDAFVRTYIEAFRPDVIFIREPAHIDGRLFDQFKDRCVLASFIGCNTNHPTNWDPFRNDVLFTLTDEYYDFYRVQGIKTERFSYGVDERLLREVGDLPKVHDCVFVGYLGQPYQRAKTALLEAVAQAFDFKWWGVRGEEMHLYPALARSWQGEVAGIDMYRVYRQARIALNDYVEMNAGKNVNMRSKEVMNVGTLLLTRHAQNIEVMERESALATFRDTEDCLAKIRHLLAYDAEREAIAAKGLEVALRDFNYRDIAAGVMSAIAEAHERKRPRLRAWK